MEPTTSTPGPALTRPVRMEILGAGGVEVPVEGELTYDPADPLALTMSLQDGTGLHAWTFARELLSEGLYEPCGDGDVHVWPCLSDTGCAVVVVEVANGVHDVLLQAGAREAAAFVSDCHVLVPPGKESVDVDRLVDSILGPQPPSTPGSRPSEPRAED